jgi:parvulin-like peptidyl-prolyl isomerase
MNDAKVTRRSLLREPLLHFLAIGALLFVVYGIVSDGDRADDELRIEITAEDIAYLREVWHQQWRRAPTAWELQRLIDDRIREEILYREAIALSLDADDTIIRRRLAQKMQFLAEDLASQIEPSEEQLLAFYHDNHDKLTDPAQFSFTHIYFSRDQRGDKAAADAELVRRELLDSAVERAPERGDRFMLESDFETLTERQVARLFGNEFAREVFQLTPDEWAGPVKSGYGLHLVRIFDTEPARLPEFEEIRSQVTNLYLDDLRRRTNEEVYERLKSRYEIIIAEPTEPTG